MAELSSEVQVKLGATLRQKIWTGIPCNCHTSNPETHWSKGTLGNSNDALLHSCSQKLALLQQSYKQHKAKDEAKSLQKKLSQIRKYASKTQESDTDTSPAADDADTEMYEIQKQSKKKVKPRRSSAISTSKKDELSTNKSDNKIDTSKPSDNSTSAGKTSAKNKSSSLKWKFRKGGLVATAVSGNSHKYELEDSGSESDPNCKQKGSGKKKKKRKCNTARKTKRQSSATKQSPKKSVKANQV